MSGRNRPRDHRLAIALNGQCIRKCTRFQWSSKTLYEPKNMAVTRGRNLGEDGDLPLGDVAAATNELTDAVFQEALNKD